MTTVGVTFPRADDSMKHAVHRINTGLELGRKTACSPGGGFKEAHQVMLHELGQASATIDQTPKEDIPCVQQSRIVEKMFTGYSGPDVPFFDEWKTLFLEMEDDVIGLVCKNDKVDPRTALESMESITRSSYKSICGSDEVLTAMTQEDAKKAAGEKLAPKIEAASIAVEKSGVNVDHVRKVVNDARAAVSCPSGLGVLTTHYPIMIGVFCAGIVIASLILKRRSKKY